MITSIKSLGWSQTTTDEQYRDNANKRHFKQPDTTKVSSPKELEANACGCLVHSRRKRLPSSYTAQAREAVIQKVLNHGK